MVYSVFYCVLDFIQNILTLICGLNLPMGTCHNYYKIILLNGNINFYFFFYIIT